MGTRLGYDLGTRCVFPSLPSPFLPLLRVFADIPSSEATPSRMKGNLAENNVISWDRDDNSWFASLWRDIQLYFSSVLSEVYPRFCHSQRSLKAQISKHFGSEDIIDWKQKINSFLSKNHKATFITIFRFPRKQNGNPSWLDWSNSIDYLTSSVCDLQLFICRLVFYFSNIFLSIAWNLINCRIIKALKARYNL